jgi:peptidoglycan hydrolase CwlO-like protein
MPNDTMTEIISSAPMFWDILKSLILAAVAFISATSGRQIEKMRGEMMAKIDRLDAQVEGLREKIDNQLDSFEKRLEDLASDYRDFKRFAHENFLRRQ